MTESFDHVIKYGAHLSESIDQKCSLCEANEVNLVHYIFSKSSSV